MIIKKSPRDIDAMAKAGELSARALRVVGAAVKPGVTTLELDRIAEETIRQGGGIPAFKGYGGFPGSICASINEQIVHGIPSDVVVLQEGDIISIDTGATVGGWVGDNAWTFPVGKISPKKQRLLEVTEASMWAGIDAARAGNHLGDIGHAVQVIAEDAGYGVVREYVGAWNRSRYARRAECAELRAQAYGSLARGGHGASDRADDQHGHAQDQTAI